MSVVVNVNHDNVKIVHRKKSHFVKKAAVIAALTGLAGFSLYKYEKANPGEIVRKLQLVKGKGATVADNLYSYLNSSKGATLPLPSVSTNATAVPTNATAVPTNATAVPVTVPDLKKLKAIGILKSEFRKIKLADGDKNESAYDMYLRYLKLLDKRCELAFGDRKKLCLEKDIISNNINRERIRLALLDLNVKI